MKGGWQYRITSVPGIVTLAIVAVAVANHSLVQGLFQSLPVVGHLSFDSAAGQKFAIEAGVTAIVVCAALFPLYKPRPRPVLDIGLSALRQVVIALLLLATIGYFDFTYRLPRATLLVAGGTLLVTVPLWFVLVRRRPRSKTGRTLIVGDNSESMDDILRALSGNIVGYVSPPSAHFGAEREPQPTAIITSDGGRPETLDEMACLGGLSRLDEVLVEYDIDTVALAFTHPDRAEFFGTLDTCYEHGITAKVHQEHADSVLTAQTGHGGLIEINLEPLDLQDRILKRLFDITFAGTALLVLSPMVIIIAAAVKLDSEGPILFSQQRTSRFGQTFTFFKFRSMVENAEEMTGVTVSKEDAGETDPRVTRVGRILRKTHLDEIPQLWSILKGDMAVVGPRPAQTEIEEEFEAENSGWVKRWFVKPGLTGLAQIEGATGLEPNKKLHYDLLYIQNQSLPYDLKITIRQFLMIGVEAYGFLRKH